MSYTPLEPFSDAAGFTPAAEAHRSIRARAPEAHGGEQQ